MQEKLSVKKVYRNAFRYVTSHLFAYGFLSVFYFLGSLAPMVIGATSFSFRVVHLLYIYLFFYFAAGFYYKQQILKDKELFVAAGLRFLTAVVLFLTSILASTVAINFLLYFVKEALPTGGEVLVSLILGSVFWLVGKYLFIFMLFVVFFIVPLFTFVSEITGKSRSLLNAYAKAKGNFIRIAMTAIASFVILLVTMIVLTFVNPIVAELVRSLILAFISIVYFKMYDFFYNFPLNKRGKKEVALTSETAKKELSDNKKEEKKPAKKKKAHTQKDDEITTEQVENSGENHDAD